MSEAEWTCSCRARIYDRPILPKTTKLAKERKMDVDEFIRQEGVQDNNLCFLTGRVCPTSQSCDAKISLGQIEKEFVAFYDKHLIDKPNAAKFFLGLLCDSISEAVRAIPTQSLFRFVGSENIDGLQSALLGELSLRRCEITKWELVVKDNLEIVMVTYPVNFPRAVAMSVKKFAVKANMMEVLEDV